MMKTSNKTEVNPLSYFEARKLSLLPPHFEVVSFTEKELPSISPLGVYFDAEDYIKSWIQNNLIGRYCVKITYQDNESHYFDRILKIGFEDPKELTYFTLACPIFHSY